MILINFHKNKTHTAIDNVRLMEIDKAVRRLRTISLDFRLTVELVFIWKELSCKRWCSQLPVAFAVWGRRHCLNKVVHFLLLAMMVFRKCIAYARWWHIIQWQIVIEQESLDDVKLFASVKLSGTRKKSRIQSVYFVLQSILASAFA